MTTFINQATLLLAVFILGCNGKSNHNQAKSLVKHSLPTEEKQALGNTPRELLKNYNGENNKLFVFVGQKISVEELTVAHRKDAIIMDEVYKAKYLVIQKVYGSFSSDTIEFVAYDHYGIPQFSKFENVLLYVSANRGLYYHQKYMYNDVYLTKDGRWAGTYAEQDYGHEYNKNTTIRPVKLEFKQEVSYPTIRKPLSSPSINIKYPKPYFKTIGTKAIAIYGNYIEDLFILKRDGYLKARRVLEDEP